MAGKEGRVLSVIEHGSQVLNAKGAIVVRDRKRRQGLRQKQGMSRRNLSGKTGFSISLLSLVERGRDSRDDGYVPSKRDCGVMLDSEAHEVREARG